MKIEGDRKCYWHYLPLSPFNSLYLLISFKKSLFLLQELAHLFDEVFL